MTTDTAISAVRALRLVGQHDDHLRALSEHQRELLESSVKQP